ncbi:MAG: bifunctional nuclease family protein [Candidatus Omnitrophica bacterium]|nr:bifunctional nuclease family protein [Candidatus Omnitrophota bacterium]MBU0878378.1 bifunctional nuclease family protein [Candidatus Omnitrophota bacterium]MBU0896188.1 bifunctional nuclease family protein [Candidatus Omnitrophota bacterium]MBU1134644.1 bifunctional nuclease family protein [Candidatus Omnitrophota bacterium]MBU1367034.1 bifunctional nuclease family protein [Candidatus Omnitrophota bacterium]
MVEVELSRIIIDEEKREQVIVLKEKTGSRFFPIVIGINEAIAIRVPLGGFASPRPLTHDFICSLIRTLEVRLEKVVIDKLVDNTFHAKLYLMTKDNEPKTIDTRPSDGIALAVRMKSPLFVEEQVFDKLFQ